MWSLHECVGCTDGCGGSDTAEVLESGPHDDLVMGKDLDVGETHLCVSVSAAGSASHDVGPPLEANVHVGTRRVAARDLEVVFVRREFVTPSKLDLFPMECSCGALHAYMLMYAW